MLSYSVEFCRIALARTNSICSQYILYRICSATMVRLLFGLVSLITSVSRSGPGVIQPAQHPSRSSAKLGETSTTNSPLPLSPYLQYRTPAAHEHKQCQSFYSNSPALIRRGRLVVLLSLCCSRSQSLSVLHHPSCACIVWHADFFNLYAHFFQRHIQYNTSDIVFDVHLKKAGSSWTNNNGASILFTVPFSHSIKMPWGSCDARFLPVRSWASVSGMVCDQARSINYLLMRDHQPGGLSRPRQSRHWCVNPEPDDLRIFVFLF